MWVFIETWEVEELMMSDGCWSKKSACEEECPWTVLSVVDATKRLKVMSHAHFSPHQHHLFYWK